MSPNQVNPTPGAEDLQSLDPDNLKAEALTDTFLHPLLGDEANSKDVSKVATINAEMAPVVGESALSQTVEAPALDITEVGRATLPSSGTTTLPPKPPEVTLPSVPGGGY